jgi:hypothetical protein
VQYGFTVNGPNVWVTDVAPFGSVQIAVDATPAFIPAPVTTDLDLDAGNVVSWNAQEGVNFQPQYSDNNVDWDNLGPVVRGDGTTKALADPAGAVGGRFYRVLRVPTETPTP